MQRRERAGPAAWLAPLLDELAALVEFDDAPFVPWPCPSETKMSPLGATTTSEGALKVWRRCRSRGCPERHQQLRLVELAPSGRSCALAAPVPRTVSVTQTFSSLSTRSMRNANMPLLKLFTELAAGVEFQDRVEIGADAGVLAAAVDGPDAQGPARYRRPQSNPSSGRRHFHVLRERLIRIGQVVRRRGELRADRAGQCQHRGERPSFLP